MRIVLTYSWVYFCILSGENQRFSGKVILTEWAWPEPVVTGLPAGTRAACDCRPAALGKALPEI
jgi:hypothetical protein